MPFADPVCDWLDKFFPVPFFIMVFVAIRPGNGVEDDMPVLMRRVVMYRKNVIIIVPEIFLTEFTDGLICGRFIRLSRRK